MAGTHATILFGTSQFKKWTGTFKPYDYTFSLGLLPSNDNCLPLSMAPRFTKSTSLSRDTKTEWEDTTMTFHSVVTMYQSCTHPVSHLGLVVTAFLGPGFDITGFVKRVSQWSRLQKSSNQLLESINAIQYLLYNLYTPIMIHNA